MTGYDRLPDDVAELFGPDATAESAYDLLTVDVPPASWIAALEIARDQLGCSYFDWLSAVDEPGTGFRVCAHVVALGGPPPAADESGAPGAEVKAPPAHGSPGGIQVRRLMLRTTVPHDAPVLPTAREVYAGADWHERETHEMFGVEFTDHPHLVPLLLPEGFEGHPLRKDFVLAARVAKAWPGAKEPGESEHGGPKRRQMLPPGVPDPNEWGPLKGQLPPAPARPARAPRAAGAAAGERPARRARTVGEGSTSQAAGAEGTAAPARRSRSVGEGSASQAAQRPDATAGTSRTRPAGDAATGAARSAPAGDAAAGAGRSAPAAPSTDAPATDAPATHGPATDAPAPSAGTAEGAAGSTPERGSTPAARNADAPWHHARPAFDSSQATSATGSADRAQGTGSAPGTDEAATKSGPPQEGAGPDSATGSTAGPTEKPGQNDEPRPQQPDDTTDPGGDPE
ncbi:NADH-quinone oxidoreductase subunit C [Streptomyces sp. NPDC005953]|uniref:NADH-quinone oxidoreductase subunit C n=1 Tax=Streptomyces sp. NPDC005953 TaxID=3156719 RepID=UPI00340003C2